MNDPKFDAHSISSHPRLNTAYLAERIADATTDLIFIFDTHTHQILYVNHAIVPLMGYKPTETSALTYAELVNLVHPDDAEARAALNTGIAGLQNGGYVESEMRLRDHTGVWHIMHTRISAFSRSPDGALEQVLGVMRDVTELRQMQAGVLERERIATALEKERELSALKNRFMTTVSHEFRTPLSIIMSSAELLERYYERMTAERRSEAVATINRQIRHLKKMLDDIWVLLDVEQSSTLFSPHTGDLRAFCSDIVDSMYIEGGRSYPIQLYTEGSLSDVQFDPNLLKPVLWNLLSNAMKYSTVGNVVRLEAVRGANEITLRVIDRGIGIRAEDRERIFDTFFRGSSVSHIPGVGLGLKIVRDNLRRHHARIEVQSEMGKGTTFVVHLPLDYSLTAS